MLTDIFAYRYQSRPIWQEYTDLEKRLLNQAFGVVKDAIPYYDSGGSLIKSNEAKWKSLHDKLARELGVDELSHRYFSYIRKAPNGVDVPITDRHTWDYVCSQFVKSSFSGQCAPDIFIKERISFIELAMRLRGEEVAADNSQLHQKILKAKSRVQLSTALRVPGDPVKGVQARNSLVNDTYNNQVAELNERFRRAGAPLAYHNGFIQITQDEMIEENIAKPFWDLVTGPVWENVDIDMKEALDRRDSNGKDPAFYAARALESTIKVISKNKGWTRGNEKGAANYIDNLISKANGRFLDVWEGELLKDYFSKVRNPFGHGPGPSPMPEFSLVQTDWAIEIAMSWIRSLIRRFNEN